MKGLMNIYEIDWFLSRLGLLTSLHFVFGQTEDILFIQMF